MSHMPECRKTHDRCDCPELEAREDLNDLRAKLSTATKERDDFSAKLDAVDLEASNYLIRARDAEAELDAARADAARLREALVAKISTLRKAREALESHQCAEDQDLDGCMACDALNIVSGSLTSAALAASPVEPDARLMRVAEAVREACAVRAEEYIEDADLCGTSCRDEVSAVGIDIRQQGVAWLAAIVRGVR